MGKLLKPRGLRGELRVYIFNEVDSTLKSGIEIWVDIEDGSYSRYIIETFKFSGNKSWIKFAGCYKREDIDHLNGLYFSIPRSSFARLLCKESYLVDLIGCKVLDEDRIFIGLVIDTISFAKQNIIVVEKMSEEVLIPYVDAHIKLFDKKGNILIVKDVEGLLN